MQTCFFLSKFPCLSYAGPDLHIAFICAANIRPPIATGGWVAVRPAHVIVDPQSFAKLLLERF